MHHRHVCDPRALAWWAMSGARGGHGPRRGGRPGGWDFPGFAPPRGPRARRGDVRAAILVLLSEGPRNGYQLMQEIEDRSDGLWRPSPGSVYPALQQLEDEALIAFAPGEGRKAYALTDEGSAYVAEHRERLGEPWEAVKDDVGESTLDLMGVMRQIGMALFQLAHSGTPEQQEEARRVLADTRRRLYRILADDAPEDATEA